jgi:hypothetical protein
MKYLHDIIKEKKRWPSMEEIDTKYAQDELKLMHDLANNYAQYFDETIEVKDSWAWYLAELSRAYLDKGDPRPFSFMQRQLNPMQLKYAPLDVIYGLYQSGELGRHKAFSYINNIMCHHSMYLQLTPNEWRVILSRPCLKQDSLRSIMYFFASGGQYCKVAPREIAMFCNPKFLRRPYNEKRVIELLRDSPCVYHEVTSMNYLQEKHDTYAAEQRRRVRMQNHAKYEYTPEFTEIFKDTGWHLPNSAAELVERGDMHHNCVANYTTLHAKNVGTDWAGRVILSRLILCDDATAEVRITLQKGDDKIYHVYCQQCKGRYNKDVLFGEMGATIMNRIYELKPEHLKVTAILEEE